MITKEENTKWGTNLFTIVCSVNKNMTTPPQVFGVTSSLGIGVCYFYMDYIQKAEYCFTFEN
jgi:hypothetical protein